MKLLDFGIATGESLTQLTQTGVILGTIAYLAPEQISHQEATAASDLYSLGVLAYEALTAEQPFYDATPVGVVRQILETQPIPAARLRPEVPTALDQLVLEMLDKDPDKRPAHDALMKRLGAIEAGLAA